MELVFNSEGATNNRSFPILPYPPEHAIVYKLCPPQQFLLVHDPFELVSLVVTCQNGTFSIVKPSPYVYAFTTESHCRAIIDMYQVPPSRSLPRLPSNKAFVYNESSHSTHGPRSMLHSGGRLPLHLSPSRTLSPYGGDRLSPISTSPLRLPSPSKTLSLYGGDRLSPISTSPLRLPSPSKTLSSCGGGDRPPQSSTRVISSSRTHPSNPSPSRTFLLHEGGSPPPINTSSCSGNASNHSISRGLESAASGTKNKVAKVVHDEKENSTAGDEIFLCPAWSGSKRGAYLEESALGFVKGAEKLFCASHSQASPPTHGLGKVMSVLVMEKHDVFVKLLARVRRRQGDYVPLREIHLKLAEGVVLRVSERSNPNRAASVFVNFGASQGDFDAQNPHLILQLDNTYVFQILQKPGTTPYPGTTTFRPNTHARETLCLSDGQWD